MADFNKVCDFGDYQNGVINVVVEIPEGSNQKVEWDRKRGIFILDRTEPMIFAKPTNYGFIPQTLDEDGDELDVLLIAPSPLPMGVLAEAKILGVMKFVDDGEVDDKIIAVVLDDRNVGDIYKDLNDLPEKLMMQIEYHFNHYKDLKKPGMTKVEGFFGVKEAKKVIAESIERWKSKA
ncbi:inorganic diphosphatase [Candidatus Saccharibacteria bacterium]|nr:inorganic diphosphatase [Candidatus Saccharibacteria bacterium]